MVLTHMRFPLIVCSLGTLLIICAGPSAFGQGKHSKKETVKPATPANVIDDLSS